MKEVAKSLENTIDKMNFDEINSMSMIISSEDSEKRIQATSGILKKILGENYSSHPDFLTPKDTEKNSIGIEEIKNLISRLKFKPYSASKKVAVIESAETMTTEAQNALLKTLEDIPSKTIIILETSNFQKLLPTIVSRCQLFEIQSRGSVKHEDHLYEPEKILKSDLSDKFKIVEEIAAIKNTEERREAVKNLIGALIQHFQKDLDQFPEHAAKLKLLQQTMTMISENVNLKLALENMMINLED